MTMTARQLLTTWIEQEAPIETVNNLVAGADTAERVICDAARRAYELIWSWSAPRYIGSAGTAQDRFFERCGGRALERRIQRAKWLAVRLCG
ncbi:hypothetical protein H8F21_14265 [Pseudomonas sp. P66]|uniref:Uncharacterized protein n=1 Tax=Pseudomonas arcuscaelestis TaxID=2710591 RepID=A0ABS2BYN2_9PSED|nr:hypothetical protein [Pseudomonas arcuscaelestis]MBM5458728.1 hypothetical protein [Pseudomonas arcuscaelestis]